MEIRSPISNFESRISNRIKRMKTCLCSLLLVLVTTAALQGQSRQSVLKAIESGSTWSPADTPTQYDDKNIENLAGKRAHAIKAYGLNGVTTETLKGSEGTVHLTLYEMSDASAAYGLFTLDRNIDEAGFSMIPVGGEGFRAGNRTEFWQSKYVVKLDGSPAAAESVAHVISQNIFGSSRKPPRPLPHRAGPVQDDREMVVPRPGDRRKSGREGPRVSHPRLLELEGPRRLRDRLRRADRRLEEGRGPLSP